MKNLKNIFKCLSVAAVAGMLSMGTVNAADGALVCEEGKTVHTNYYMFLASNPAADINAAIDKAASESTEEKTVYHNIFSGANKWNNIPLGTGTRQGNIPITIGSDDNTEKGLTEEAIANLDKLGLEPWTASDFWKRFYAAHQNKDDKTNIYSPQNSNVSYILHDGYWTYTDANGNGQSATQTSPYKDLLKYLSTRVNSLTNTSPIVRTGTDLPFTSVVAPTTDFGNSTSDTLLFRVNRQFSESDKKSGIDLQNGQNAVIYSPAVYYVQFCAAKTTTDTPATGTYTVRYDANGGKDAPATQTANVGACVEISKTAPKYSGQNFLGWSTNPKAVEPDKKYAAGEKYCEDKDVTLYAVWNTKTGVSAHVIAFGALALVAAGALVIAKKKNLFKQI